MTEKQKGRDRRAPKGSLILARLKAAIVRLALWGLLPVRAAARLIRRGGLRHE